MLILCVGVVTSLTILMVSDVNGYSDVYMLYKGHKAFVLGKALRSINTMLWIFSVLGFSTVYLKLNSPLLTYANEAVYPFYILHQTVMVVLSYYVIQLNSGMAS